MKKVYSSEERFEVLKLANEIGNRAAADRLGIKLDTLYTWVSKAKSEKTGFKEDANYGVRRIYDYLRLKRNYIGSLRTVHRICKEHNLMIHMKRKPNGITKADAQAQKSENLIKQDFTAEAPNEKWLTDITEIPCKDGKLYLAAILDCYDGTIRGFKMADNMQADLCVEAFQRACRDDGADGMVLHSDRGSQV